MTAAWKEFFGFGKEKGHILGSPMDGEAVALEQVDDPTFSEKILGDGIALIPCTGRVVAPVAGTIAIMFETGHAVSLVSEKGTEILIHIGLNTVNLKGKYFHPKVKANDKVKQGDLLLEFDLEQIIEAGYDPISPVVICNSATYSEITTFTGELKELDRLMVIKN